SEPRFVPCWRAYRITAIAPATSSQRKCRLPCFEILPSLSLPPVECCLGTKPIHAARLRPDENTFQSPTSATSAVTTVCALMSRPPLPAAPVSAGCPTCRIILLASPGDGRAFRERARRSQPADRRLRHAVASC